ncbi:MAG: DUF4097 family beta strand repeat-containing protein [Bacteroidota bacterium]
METKQTTLLKILVFLLVGVIFVAAMIAYSNARSGRQGRFVEEGWTKEGFGEVQKNINRVFDVKPGGELTLDTDAGSVIVEAWDKDQVSVVVELSGDEQQLKRFRVEFKSDDSTVSIVGKQRGRFFPWHWQSSDIVFHIKVPSKFRPKINTSGGDVSITGVEGKVRGETSGGTLKLFSIVGDVYGETSGGDVVIRNIKGDVQGYTSGGDIKVDSVLGGVKVTTSGGEVVLLRVNGRIYGETSGGNIEARLLGENRGVHLETSGGNVSVYLRKDIAANLQASTSGGSVKCDLPVMVLGKISEDELNGKLNGGGNLIELSTSGGNINIRPLD